VYFDSLLSYLTFLSSVQTRCAMPQYSALQHSRAMNRPFNRQHTTAPMLKLLQQPQLHRSFLLHPFLLLHPHTHPSPASSSPISTSTYFITTGYAASQSIIQLHQILVLTKEKWQTFKRAQKCIFRGCAGCCAKEFETTEKQNQRQAKYPTHNKCSAQWTLPVTATIPTTLPLVNPC
jgi:hypothetical protein